MSSFWDFCAPFYDAAERANGRAYGDMLNAVREFVHSGASVLEVAAGTGAISLTVSDKASHILCTDISEKMLSVARKKAIKQGVKNISFGNLNIFETGQNEVAFDVVIASQVLHLIDKPEKAAAELKRIAKEIIILPMSYTKNLRGTANLGVRLYKLFGFAPKIEFAPDEYLTWLDSIGFTNCEYKYIPGKLPMGVAVWRKL
jgi:ubiquinone/menaquinone biosynthesis C-methylase UbiE